MFITTEVEIDEFEVLAGIDTEVLRRELAERDGAIGPDDIEMVRMKDALYFWIRDQKDVPQLVRDYVWEILGKVV
jgi:hypothetical protein